MAIKLHMDHHVPRAITDGLRLRVVDVITAAEDGTSDWDDPDLLDRARELKRVLFTRDYHFLQEAKRRQQKGILFQGIIHAHQLRVPIGTCINNLEIIAKAGEPEDLHNQVQFLPL
jgi:predicted nuclease of predicted toxin-antitoxin system